MRNNQPVTQRLHDFPESLTLMSTTDIHSRVTYANEAFIEVSGFSREELLGEPHNLVRHPDMPTQAFADMWATLRSGQSWTALVKNRRKNGDHYWVRANATLIRRDGRVAGYMSVRTKPDPAEVEVAEALYRKFREGKAGSLAFFRGIIVRKGWLAWMSMFRVMPVRWRIRLALGICVLPGLIGLFFSGLSGLGLQMEAAMLLAGAVCGCLLLEWQLARPLTTILAQAQTVASGQPGRNVHLNRVDEIGMLLRAVNQAGLNLRALVDDVAGRAALVDQGSANIAAGNADLVAHMENQASALEEVATSMEQFGAAVRRNADSAHQGNALARTASEVAVRGGRGGGAGGGHDAGHRRCQSQDRCHHRRDR